MSNLDKLIEYINNTREDLKSALKTELISVDKLLELIVEKAEQLQKEEPKIYTQEEYDAEYWRGWHDYGESL
ncbi:MAG: hypothetical protein WCP46_00400 [Alphaproteobacteria bacterium]